MVRGCRCAAIKAVSENALQFVRYTNTNTNLLSEKQGGAARGLGVSFLGRQKEATEDWTDGTDGRALLPHSVSVS